MGIDKTDLRIHFRVTLAVSIFLCQTTALHLPARAEKIDDAAQIERIRHIVLSQGNNPAGLAHLIQLSSNLQPAAAAKLYSQLAKEYLSLGRLDKAAEVLHQLVNQHLDQPSAAEGLTTLVRLYSSSEVAHTAKNSLLKSEGHSLPIYAIYVAQQAISQRRDLANNPALAFQCAVASRLTGNLQSAKGWLSPLRHSKHNKFWHQGVLVETWLQDRRNAEPPKPTIHCAHTDKRPLLDGKLNEPPWPSAKPISLTNDSAQIQFAHDEKFLYLAIRCQKLAGENYPSEKLPRSYDADLTGQDHIRLLLDLDRDYATYFQFSIDHRGQTADRCWLDASWNPSWFVATSSDNTSWTVEAAIPWSELTDHPPQTHDAWALAIERQPATKKPATWVGPTAKDPGPESFGLLLFD